MSRFPSAAHLASWAGMCPGQYESAGKSRSGRARHGNSWLPRHLAVAAMAAARTKDSYFAAQYARLVRTRGKTKARKAVGPSMLVAIWHMLEAGVPYAELGADWFDKRSSPDRRARRHLADLRSLGWVLADTPEGLVLTPSVPVADGPLSTESLHSNRHSGLRPESLAHASSASDSRYFHPRPAPECRSGHAPRVPENVFDKAGHWRLGR